MTHQLPTLIRRELWEHRALWIAPVAVAACVLTLIAIIGQFNVTNDTSPTFWPQDLEGLGIPRDKRQGVFAIGLWSVTAPLYLTLLFVMWAYATDCLYAERRDRSILFWRSMPVSDAATVIAKLIVVTVIAPLIVWLVSLGATLIAGGIWSLRGWAHLFGLEWNTLTWARVQLVQLLGIIEGTLWYAPIVGYLMLLSVWARRAVSLWALLPPILAGLLELSAFHTHYIFAVIWYRLLWWSAATTGPHAAPASAAHSAAGPLAGFYNVDLWLGLALAAAFVYGAIRIRRYRDDS